MKKMFLSVVFLFMAFFSAVVPARIWPSVAVNNRNKDLSSARSLYAGVEEPLLSMPSLLRRKDPSTIEEVGRPIWIQDEDMSCSKFSCQHKPCCDGHCFQIAGMPMCILLPGSGRK